VGEILEFVDSILMQKLIFIKRRIFESKPFLVRSMEMDVEVDRIDEEDDLNKDENKIMYEDFCELIYSSIGHPFGFSH
jgi:hypothetical protein